MAVGLSSKTELKQPRKITSHENDDEALEHSPRFAPFFTPIPSPKVDEGREGITKSIN